MNIGLVVTLLGTARPFLPLLWKVPGWVREAQKAHGQENGPEKLKEVCQKAVDWAEQSFGEIDDSLEEGIVQVTSMLVDEVLDLFKREKEPAFVPAAG
jgi:hypothetical protein